MVRTATAANFKNNSSAPQFAELLVKQCMQCVVVCQFKGAASICSSRSIVRQLRHRGGAHHSLSGVTRYWHWWGNGSLQGCKPCQ